MEVLFEKIEKLEEKIKGNPKDSELYLELGDLCISSRNNKVYEKGMRACGKAFSLNPSSQLANEIAEIYYFDDKMLYGYRYRLKAIKLEPNNLDNYVELLETLKYYIELLKDNNLDDKDTPKKVKKALEKLEKYRAMAISIGEKILKENPNDYDILCDLSNLYYVQKDEDKALDYGKRAFEIDKKDGKAYYWLKYFYERKEDYQKAIELCLSVDDYKEAGNIYRHDLRDYPKAIECYLNVGDYHAAGNIYKLDLKDYPKAIEFYYKAVESNDKKPLYHRSLGLTLNYIQEHEKALHYLKIAKELDPNFINSYNNLVYVYNDLGNYEEVRKNLNIAYKMNPNNSVTLITKMEIDLILDNSIDKNLEDKILELFSENTEVMGEYSMLKILFNITQNKDMKDELLKWKEEYKRLSDDYSLVALENWAKKQDEALQDRLLEALRVFK